METRDFDHIILTRFSVRFSAEQEPANEDWLAYRWAFFRDALASSLTRQTERRFTWLVFFDNSAPEWLRDEVEEASPGLFIPIWLHEPWAHGPLRAAVTAHSSKPWLISTRVDSDDAVAREFVESVQSHFARQDSLYVNFLHGVQVARTGEVFRYWYAFNPFISYIERRGAGTPRTVFQDFRHGYSTYLADTLNVVGDPAWMQVVHGSNLMNEVRGPRASPRGLDRVFDLDLPYQSETEGLQLVWEWSRSAVKLCLLWARHPHLLRAHVGAQRLRLKGTTVLPKRTEKTT